MSYVCHYYEKVFYNATRVSLSHQILNRVCPNSTRERFMRSHRKWSFWFRRVEKLAFKRFEYEILCPLRWDKL